MGPHSAVLPFTKHWYWAADGLLRTLGPGFERGSLSVNWMEKLTLTSFVRAEMQAGMLPVSPVDPWGWLPSRSTEVNTVSTASDWGILPVKKLSPHGWRCEIELCKMQESKTVFYWFGWLVPIETTRRENWFPCEKLYYDHLLWPVVFLWRKQFCSGEPLKNRVRAAVGIQIGEPEFQTSLQTLHSQLASADCANLP